MKLKYNKQAINDLAVEYYNTRDRRTLDRLFVELDPFIRFFVRKKIKNKSLSSGLSHDDLFQSGMLGAMYAIEKRFSPENGLFTNYAHWWINQKMTILIDNEFSGGTIKRNGRNTVLIDNYRKYYNRISSKNQHMTRDEIHDEISRILNVKRDNVDIHYARCLGPVYLNSVIKPNEEGPTERIDMLEDPDAGNENDINTKIDTDKMLKVISEITYKKKWRWKKVLYMRLLSDPEDHSFCSVGKEIGATKQRAQQIEADCMKYVKFWVPKKMGVN